MNENSKETTESVRSNIPSRKSVKNIYDGNTGFSLMINLYVIKYIYYHINKARCFIDEDERGIKKKSFPIYSNSYFPLSRQRLNRINKGEPFELTRSEVESIITAYGIEIKYFRKEDPLAFVIDGIDEIAWKCFYNYYHYGKYSLPPDLENNKDYIEKKGNTVISVLKNLAQNWEDTLMQDDPVYAVCYYFHYGQRFDRPSVVKSLKDILSGLDYREWENENEASLNEMVKLLRGHYNYVNSLCTLQRLLNEQQSQKSK